MGGVVDTLFGGGQGAGYADMASSIGQGMDELKKYYSEAKGYMQPFYDQGTKSMGDYAANLAEMKDPQQYYNKIMSGYSMSPAAQYNIQQGVNTAMLGNSASGLSGSGAEMQQLQKIGQGISSQDQQQYLSNILGLGDRYRQGQAGLMGQGFSAGSNIGNWGMDTGSNMSKLYQLMGQAKAGQDMASSSGIGNLIGSIGSLFF